MSAVEPITECDIFDRIVQADELQWSEDQARAILKLDFAANDRQRMQELLVKNREDALTDPERQQMESYRKVGFLLDLLRSKARIALRESQR